MTEYVDKLAFFKVPLAQEDADIPRLGKVKLLEFDGTRRDEWENYTVQHRIGTGKDAKPDTRGVKALAIVLSVVDPKSGALVFERKDVTKVQSMPGDILDALFSKIRTLSHLYEAETKAAEGNSDGEGSDTTGSASPQG